MHIHAETYSRQWGAETVLQKNIPLTLFERVVCERWVGDWTKLQDIAPPTPTFLAITRFLSPSPGLLNRGLGAKPLLGHGSHSSIFSSTDLNFLSPELYIIIWRPPTSCERQIHTQFNPSSVKVTPLISSTGCTCYLHRCISSLTARPGKRQCITNWRKSKQ